jgi:hypothetical protein
MVATSFSKSKRLRKSASLSHSVFGAVPQRLRRGLHRRDRGETRKMRLARANVKNTRRESEMRHMNMARIDSDTVSHDTVHSLARAWRSGHDASDPRLRRSAVTAYI